jgi:hypothetical protein
MEYVEFEKRLISFLIALAIGHESSRTKLDALKADEGVVIIDMFQEVLISRGLFVATQAFDNNSVTYESDESYLMLMELLTFLGLDQEILAIDYYLSVRKKNKTAKQYLDMLDVLLINNNDEEAMMVLNKAAIDLSKVIFETGTFEEQQRMMDTLDRI